MGPTKPKPSMQDLYAHTAEDWQEHKETITRLYLHEKFTLSEVMEYMALHHFFFATPKMYRTRIRRWGIDKNNKGTEVAYMLRLKKQRDALGKKSSFFIRNRPVDWEDIERYLTRTPNFWAKHGRDAPDLSHEITCTTPPPGSPAPASLATIPQKLDAAQELRVHEEILRFFREYTEGSFEQGLWQLSPDHKRYFGRGGAEASARLNAWYDKVRNVSDWPGRDADVVRVVNYLLDDLPQFIKDQDFTVFPALMRCCFYLSARRPALGRAVAEFVARLCGVILGEKHPMSLAWSRIKSLPLPDYLLVLQGTAKVRLDQLESRQPDDVEDDNTITALREYLLVLRLRGPSAMDELDRATCRARKQVSETSKRLTASHCRLLLGTASSYITCRRFDEAQEVLDIVGAHLPTASAQDPQFCRVLPTYLFIMGFIRYVTRRMDEAVNYFLQTYSALVKTRGSHSSAVSDILIALIDFPGLHQNPEDLKHWREKLAHVQTETLAMAKKGARRKGFELSELWDEPLDTDVNTSMW
ncbi:Clr5 domain-containing protein [Corynascus novoguineensis]|uniref:Clr5 domain-containing protein n=1 Tax=Corynascus novoguineensis TaxID=1126955 RepID=A0AAN7CS62_9PEZI|nr:Clr5 domain-containing protein [Corynascus novoguineensis]